MDFNIVVYKFIINNVKDTALDNDVYEVTECILYLFNNDELPVIQRRYCIEYIKDIRSYI
ncbi:hypothetical protein [Tepidibacter mesophilus]|uniref:hypothetical protein n=1 Tax=Tepidibacter mesophilus TaxID=655607 RepID=UPI0011AF912A|nr:hypothetical protein [Tepidibacter mesophilus]